MAKVRVDKIVKGNVVFHDHGIEDLPMTTLDSRYVNITGDTMTGDLDLQEHFLVLKASDGSRWRVSVETDGALRTSVIVDPGSPIGLLLTLTNT